MKKIVIAATISVVLALMISLPVLAAYIFTIQVTNPTATNYGTIAMIATGAAGSNGSNNKWLAANGIFTETTGRDTSMEYGGATIPHMLADTQTLIATEVYPNMSDAGYTMTTGNTPADFSIIAGYGGYVTIKDAAALEPGNNFENEFSGLIRTDAAMVGADFVSKPDSFLTEVISTGNIASYMYFDGQTYIVNDDANMIYGNGGATRWAAQTFTPANSGYIVSVYVKVNTAGGTTTVDIRQTTAGVPNATVVGTTSTSSAGLAASPGSFQTITFATPVAVTAGTTYAVALHDTNNGPNWRYDTAGGTLVGQTYWTNDNINWNAWGGADSDFMLRVNMGIRVTAAVTSGNHIINTTADTVNLKLYVDSVEEDSAALGGASAKDTANDWVIMSNASPSLDYYQHSVGGTLIINYAPADIIHGRAYSAGTVTVTNGDATVEGAAGTAWDEDLDAGAIFVSADGVWYVISSVTDADTLELTAVYGGGTLAGQAYNFYPRLPDRQGTTQDGRFTFGANPGTTTATVLSIAPETSVSAGGGVVVPDRPDVIGDVNLDPGNALSTAPSTNPFAPLFEVWADMWDMPDITPWILFAFFGVILSMLGVYSLTKHVGFSIMAGGVVTGLFSIPTIHVLPAGAFLMVAIMIVCGAIVEART